MSTIHVNSAKLALALAVSALCSNAYASDGTISFTGEVTGSTCTIDVNGSGSTSATVTLPTISTTALSSATTTAGRTPFFISLTGCTAADATSVSAYFEPGANLSSSTPGVLTNIASTTPATNVAIQLLNSSLAKIALNSATQNGTTSTITGGTATLNYYAEYLAVGGAATAGNVQTSTLYSIVYP